MNGAILEIEELCGGLTAPQREKLEHGMREEHVDLVLELCRRVRTVEGVKYAIALNATVGAEPGICGAQLECQNPRTPANHPCPYQQELYDNHQPFCTCCKSCERECARDI